MIPRGLECVGSQADGAALEIAKLNVLEFR